MPIVSKTYYLLGFSYILPLQRLPKICTISYKMRLPTPCTYFDLQKWHFLICFGYRDLYYGVRGQAGPSEPVGNEVVPGLAAWRPVAGAGRVR